MAMLLWFWRTSSVFIFSAIEVVSFWAGTSGVAAC